MDSLSEVLLEKENICITENGAVGYKTSGKNLVDINFSIASMRTMTEGQILHKFVKTFYENKMLAVKWLFFVRDVRAGIGERRLFRVCMKYLVKNHMEIARAVAALIPEYGRYDDWICFFDTELEEYVMDLIKAQLEEDQKNMQEGQSISLLAKWLPSVNASSENTKKEAKKIVQYLNLTEGNYRKMLSSMRAYLKVVEVSMSKGEWKKIAYNQVPSRANLIYNSAFLKRDETRRREFLGKLAKGEETIHSDVVFPHDIVHKYKETQLGWHCPNKVDEALEAMWKALPDYVQNAENTICVSDGSGSMTVRVGNTRTTALEVAIALTIYFAERSTGQFCNRYITFSESPQIVNLGNGDCLKEKIEIALGYSEIANTNIEKVFRLILTTAVAYAMTQEELPANILILSDMEFDSCARDCNQRIFEEMKREYEEHGYQLPRLIFWNINSRTGAIPVRSNPLGVALVSGFSPAIVKMVLSGQTDPYECILEQLSDERYDAVEEALLEVL